MAKWHGKVGFSETVKTAPGVWEAGITERPYRGDVIQIQLKNQGSGGVNDNVNIANKISIVADLYASQNMGSIKYIEFMGEKWKVTDIAVQRPRLILTIGGLYNERSEQTEIAE